MGDIQHIIAHPYSDVGWPLYWPQFLQEERAKGRQHGRAEAIRVRFELGLPLL